MTLVARLFLSPRTVKVHVPNIFAKRGVSNRAAPRFALDHDFI
jgi:DNA-binding CsgD family transcriptional regulator